MKKQILTTIAILFSFNTFSQEEKIAVDQSVSVGEDTVRGTLVSKFPLKHKKLDNQPLVIIIPGSGPTDRDGNSAMLQGANNTFLQLADSLLQKGIATYRYDKLGVGESTMSRPESEFDFYDNVEVVKAIYEKMDDLGFDDIYLLGHSEGSLVGILAAQELKVDGLISVAGSGRNFHELLKEQLHNNLPPEMQESTLRKIDSVKEGHTVTQYNPMLASLLRESVQPYLRSFFKYTPTEELEKLQNPVLIIQGGRDLQVEEKDAEALKAAKPDAKYLFYLEMNHVLKMVDASQEQNQAAYYDPDFPLNPKLAGDIAEWISKN